MRKKSLKQELNDLHLQVRTLRHGEREGNWPEAPHLLIRTESPPKALTPEFSHPSLCADLIYLQWELFLTARIPTIIFQQNSYLGKVPATQNMPQGGFKLKARDLHRLLCPSHSWYTPVTCGPRDSPAVEGGGHPGTVVLNVS